MHVDRSKDVYTYYKKRNQTNPFPPKKQNKTKKQNTTHTHTKKPQNQNQKNIDADFVTRSE